MTTARPHVVLTVTLSEWGGAQAYVYQLAHAARARYEVTVLCGPAGPLVERLRADGVSVVEIPALRRHPHPLRDLEALRHLTRFLSGARVDLLHANSTKAGFLSRLAARRARIPVVVFTAHGWAFTEGRARLVRWLLAKVERLAAAMTTMVICVSNHDRDLAVGLRVAHPERLMVIHNGIDPTAFAPAAGFADGGRARLRRVLRLGIEPAVVMVGRLAPPKDPFTLLEALDGLPVGRIVIAGDGPLRPRVEATARRVGLADRVTLLGFHDDIPALLRACDIFALPSHWEGLPLAVIEAMMAGLPVVATSVGGLSELVEHGVTGLLVPAGDVRALREALAGLLADEGLRSRMGHAGQRRALEHFTAERMVRDTLEVYERLMSGICADPPQGRRRRVEK